MNCANHVELPAVAFCRSCGKPLCGKCRQEAQGTVYCDEHIPNADPIPGSPYAQSVRQPVVDTSPGLAFLLGLIPGVGAIYNGQYAKGLVHALIFGLLISIMSNGGAGGLEPLFGMLIAVFYCYMPLEAYQTARKRRDGEPVDEFSSVLGSGPTVSDRFPVGGVVLIVAGVLLLMNTLGYLDFRYLARFWPVLLILFGVYKLWDRFSPTPGGGR